MPSCSAAATTTPILVCFGSTLDSLLNRSAIYAAVKSNNTCMVLLCKWWALSVRTAAAGRHSCGVCPRLCTFFHQHVIVQSCNCICLRPTTGSMILECNSNLQRCTSCSVCLYDGLCCMRTKQDSQFWQHCYTSQQQAGRMHAELWWSFISCRCTKLITRWFHRFTQPTLL